MELYDRMVQLWHIVDGKYVDIVQIEKNDEVSLYTNGKLEATLNIATNKYTIEYND